MKGTLQFSYPTLRDDRFPVNREQTEWQKRTEKTAIARKNGGTKC
jgi:hypothetical protein